MKHSGIISCVLVVPFNSHKDREVGLKGWVGTGFGRHRDSILGHWGAMGNCEQGGGPD